MSAAAPASEEARPGASGMVPKLSAELSSESGPRTAPAARVPTRQGRLARMPRWLRIVLTGFAFANFFTATTILGLFLPLVMLFAPRKKAVFTRKLNARMRIFGGFARDLGLIDYWPLALPAELEGRAFLLVSNHPSLLDVVLTLSSLPQLSCVAKGGWYGSWLMGPMLRRTDYVPGAGYAGDDEVLDDVPVVGRIERKLRSGVPMLAFPEGTRSGPRTLRRFRRGAIEAAIRAEVPILPLFIDLNPAFLMKGQPFYHVPPITPVYRFEWLETIETAGRDLDSKQVTRELQARYEARFARQVRDRDALARELG
ncbi:MAG TPA: lysophospholipid acyltransferase family protein [Sandaracinaceae bacterium LLY-WYZ-13_1]|nr:lysophospholipid acyltransferase family protein [Sandaracinaceae bacterium LLY-WYZ-13_1]